MTWRCYWIRVSHIVLDFFWRHFAAICHLKIQKKKYLRILKCIYIIIPLELLRPYLGWIGDTWIREEGWWGDGVPFPFIIFNVHFYFYLFIYFFCNGKLGTQHLWVGSELVNSHFSDAKNNTIIAIILLTCNYLYEKNVPSC